MKTRFLLFSFLSTVACLILYQIILTNYFNSDIPILKLILYIFLPVLLAAFIIHLYFSILAWDPVEKFLNFYFPEHKDFLNKNILIFWKEIVTDHQKKQSELEGKINRYFNILNHLEEGILIVDKNGKILFNNLSAETVLNFPGSVIDKFYWEVLQNSEIKNQISESLHNHTKQWGVFVLHSPIDRSVAYLIMPIAENFQSKSEQLLLVLSDVTKIKKLEKVRTDFVANVSHELKSPLGAILGYVETMIDEPLLEVEKRKKFLEIVYQNGKQLDAIIDDLLILSQLESDKKLSITRFNPKRMLLDTIDLFAEKIKEQKLIMITDLIDQSIEMLADKGKIQQLIINLLDNAIKYSKLDGEIDLSLFRQKGQIVLVVKDNGIGIPMMEQDRIFERFYRVDKARSNNIQGTGLGLSIVKHIVELHHGSITFTSKRNEGSTFTVSIPENLTES